MTDLIVDGDGLEQVAVRIAAATHAARLPASVAVADAGVLGSPVVASAVHDAATQQRKRGDALAETLAALSEFGALVPQQFAATDTDLAGAL